MIAIRCRNPVGAFGHVPAASIAEPVVLAANITRISRADCNRVDHPAALAGGCEMPGHDKGGGRQIDLCSRPH